MQAGWHVPRLAAGGAGEAVQEEPQGPGAVAGLLGGAGVADARGQQQPPPAAAVRPPGPRHPPVEQGLPGGVPGVAVRGPFVPVPDGHPAEHVHRVQALPGAHALHDPVPARRLLRRPHLPPFPDRLHRAVFQGVWERGACHPALQDRQEVPVQYLLVRPHHRAASAAVCDLDSGADAEGIRNGEQEGHPSLQHHLPVPPPAFPDLPAHEADRHGHRCHDGERVGQRRVQSHTLHARKPCAGSVVVPVLGAEAGGVLEGGVPPGRAHVSDRVLRLQHREQQQDDLVPAEQHNKLVHPEQQLLPVWDLRGGAGPKADHVGVYAEVFLLLLVGAEEPQNLATSLFIGEISFAIVIGVLGLVLFALLIGNMQSYLQATMIRLEEWRTKRTDMERWMHHRQIPQQLKQCVRRYQQYTWVATRGVDEEALLKDLPMDIRRDIKRHLCLDLVRRVPLFDEMDERTLEAICERLRPALYTRGTRLVRELDPVDSMLFIIRGYLDSYTTQGGRSGFFNSCRIGAGEFCGEELLTWALDPRPSEYLPRSTRTVRAVSEVEAFALVAEDLRFVASQFRRLHSARIRHRFRFYSHQWRTWAACFIQAAWRRHKRRRASMELRMMPEGGGGGARAGGGGVRCRRHSCDGKALKKPMEPDFTVEEEDD
ncbi:uncharacterized protein LOC100844899 isoform X5 [Brachypodium distachyon]|uniref:uncharacterized protein LOC100844899 isoform X5 n=1 Tax=Brachypodium distachyon TaxID=15368 RepID=UPI00052FF363|nr:uncharacterized protein LOC100844899 isoform X5 [Brachypodium distachyon]|eukprot:XP_010235733.1 uncharacterized protein LOC100844899 isoform X5 [Brachypodium distachyon]